MNMIHSKLRVWLRQGLIVLSLLLYLSTPSITSGQTQITVSPATRHQAMVGFGGALTWYSNRIYSGAPTTLDFIHGGNRRARDQVGD